MPAVEWLLPTPVKKLTRRCTAKASKVSTSMALEHSLT